MTFLDFAPLSSTGGWRSHPSAAGLPPTEVLHMLCQRSSLQNRCYTGSASRQLAGHSCWHSCRLTVPSAWSEGYIGLGLRLCKGSQYQLDQALWSSVPLAPTGSTEAATHRTVLARRIHHAGLTRLDSLLRSGARHQQRAADMFLPFVYVPNSIPGCLLHFLSVTGHRSCTRLQMRDQGNSMQSLQGGGMGFPRQFSRSSGSRLHSIQTRKCRTGGHGRCCTDCSCSKARGANGSDEAHDAK